MPNAQSWLRKRCKVQESVEAIKQFRFRWERCWNSCVTSDSSETVDENEGDNNDVIKFRLYRLRYKILNLCDSEGCCYNFSFCCGKEYSAGKNASLGTCFVLNLTKTSYYSKLHFGFFLINFNSINLFMSGWIEFSRH